MSNLGLRSLDFGRTTRISVAAVEIPRLRNPNDNMHHLLEIWSGWVLHWGYLGIVVLMAMESSIFPVPSEVVIPPAAFLAAQGHLNFWGVIVAGTVGSYLGAAITYWISRALGRALIVRYGRFFLHRPRKTRTGRDLAESLRNRRRLFCAITAGGAPSDLYSGRNRADELCHFQHVTIAGSAIWCTVLAYLG